MSIFLFIVLAYKQLMDAFNKKLIYFFFVSNLNKGK